ncbi:MAG: S-layer homology domain-containing protein [Oscillospiraceae bacterium]|nr:S-layer homology domain-containing protein [Oscillospiraceae bacterium]
MRRVIVQKTISGFIVLALMLSLCSALGVQAADTGTVWDGTVDISWYDPSKSEYYISTPAQLAGLAALINGMADPTCPKIIGDQSYLQSVKNENTTLVGAGGGNVSDTTYGSNINFAYKTVYLTSDMDMGGVYQNGAWSGPNWTPIGGKFPMKPSVVDGDCYTLDTRFCGVLDGQGHTVRNIYCDRYAAKGFPYSMAIGLVGFLGGTPDSESNATASFENNWQPAVRNVVLGTGYIYGRRMVGGLVGRAGKTSNGIVIENCANFADIHNTDAKGIGGIVGSGWGTGVIRNCYNAGSVTTTYACPAGGICGNNQGFNIYNCYNVGTIDSNGMGYAVAIGGHDSGTYEVTNCYYLEGCDDDPESGGWYTGNSKTVTVDITACTAAELKSEATLTALNAAGTVFVADSNHINHGYPILWYQTGEAIDAAGRFDVSLQQPSAGGTISADASGSVSAGKTVTISAEAQGGWRLEYFMVNGVPIDADFFVVSEAATISALFVEVKPVTVHLPSSSDSYLSFSKTGYEMAEDEMVYVTNKPITDGETVLEGNIISVNAVPYIGAVPNDPTLIYTGAYTVSATNTQKNSTSTFLSGGTFTVTGEGDVSMTVTQNTALKSWLYYADTSWYLGGQEYYTITTPEQLAGMAYLVNVEGVTFAGITLRLGNDISLSSADGRIWEACGTGAINHFSGTFDANGYNIYDMSAYNVGSYAGLFGYCTGATIQNVTVRGTVTCDASTSYAAGIVGYASGCMVENCINYATVHANGKGVGGIVANTCDNTTVKDCVNYAPIYGTSGVGGIVGICYTGGDLIYQCQNYGTVESAGSASAGTGGVVGQLSGSLDTCGSFADVISTDNYSGGIAGYTNSRFDSYIKNCVSTGAVTSSSQSQTAAVGAAVGYAQYLTYENLSATGSVSTSAAFVSQFKGGLIGHEGTVNEEGTPNAALLPTAASATDAWVQPPTQQAPWKVTFIADGVTVSTQQYSSASDDMEAPAVPVKDGYTGSWSSYTLGSYDIVVDAVYIPVVIRGGERITQNGTYFLDYSTAGEVTIDSGLTVTLKGMGSPCNELAVHAAANTFLTLEDVCLNGTQTLLTLNGGTLTLSGNSAIVGTCDTKGNLSPTIWVYGDETISGTGILSAYSGAGNATMNLDPDVTLSLKSGTLSMRKDGQLGIQGGALCANDATVTISGGNFYGYTNSDNVSVICAKTLQITGGVVRAQAEKSVAVLDGGNVTITGGILYCKGHSPNSSNTVKTYSGIEAISGLTGTAACELEADLPFADITVTDTYFEDVATCYRSGYFTGTSATEFSPESSMTRAMFVTVLYRMDGSPSTAAQTSFTDLTQTWYQSAVTWAVNNGITSGTTATTFSPEQTVTREQAAVFLRRYQEWKGASATPANGDSGAGASDWARASVAWAVEFGLLNSGDDFVQNATRCELATAVARMQSTYGY